MSISSTVAALAQALAAAPATAAHADLAPALAGHASMPARVAEARLDLWEEALLPLRAEAGRSPAHAAAVAILELGRIHLYGDIDPALTAEYLGAALAAVAAAGGAAPAPDALDVTAW